MMTYFILVIYSMIINYNFPCFTLKINIIIIVNRIGGVMISVFASTVIIRLGGFVLCYLTETTVRGYTYRPTRTYYPDSSQPVFALSP
jgi:hypothetical protein